MEMKCFSRGIFGSNSYIVWEGTEGVIIDAGVSDEEVMKFVVDNNIKINYIILTHGHIDHIYYADSLREQTGAKLIVHKNDNKALIDPNLNGSLMFGRDMAFNEADKTVEDGEIINVGDLKIEVIHTPGHSSGSMCLKIDGKLFSGDTLFYLAYGRTDLSGGSQKELDNSFRNKLLKLEDNIEVYPGHGNSTTIGFEKKNNPYIKSL
ncbi:MBL fold metallo-hydrolase [Acetivibrio cellulolyticus]|uniref:MBL fold metallo-hydrolase n=1 Tax=Acetivibrio cellulolyticus TaxID=35830 RepID=UPI0001E2C6CE|nr:MBL fold metallo-hydrolase [Acetivibrio cellulolyticus]